MVTSTTLFYIIFSWITLSLNLVLVFSLLSNFLRKRTTGTLLLFTTYVIISLGALIGAIVYTIEAFAPQWELTIGFLQSISTITPFFAIIFIYMFACRHILKDNEVVKSITIIIITAYITFIGTMYLLGVFEITKQNVEGAWYQLITTPISNTSLTNIALNSLVIILLITVFQYYVYGRVAGKSFILAHRTDKIVRKRGLQMIGWGLVIYMIGGAIITFELGIPWSEGSFAPVVFWSLRKIVFLASYIVLYIGWIMPDWFRRRIRGKTWFEMKYKSTQKI